MNYKQLQDGFAQQVADQRAQVEELKTALRKLEQKLTEAHSMSDMLIAQHRRSRALSKASDARMALADGSSAAAFDRMQRKVLHTEAVSQAKSEMLADNTEDKLAALEKGDRIEQMLSELKAKKGK
jgi:phage shock protein A